MGNNSVVSWADMGGMALSEFRWGLTSTPNQARSHSQVFPLGHSIMPQMNTDASKPSDPKLCRYHYIWLELINLAENCQGIKTSWKAIFPFTRVTNFSSNANFILLLEPDHFKMSQQLYDQVTQHISLFPICFVLFCIKRHFQHPHQTKLKCKQGFLVLQIICTPSSLWQIVYTSCQSNVAITSVMPKSYRLKMVSMKFPVTKAEKALPFDENLLNEMNREDVKRLKAARSSFKWVNISVAKWHNCKLCENHF